MIKAFYIAKKELGNLFKTPMAYIILFIALSVFNFFFFLIIEENREATLRDVFLVMQFMLITFIPVLTMRTFAEEKQTGTMEFMLTCPIREWEIVLGKFLGNTAFYTIMVLLTSIYYLILKIFSSPDAAQILLGYFAIFLQGTMFIAIGTMISSWTKNQVVAAIITYLVLFVLYFSQAFIKYVGGWMKDAVSAISAINRIEAMISGVVVLSDLVYYLSMALFCLLVTRIIIEKKI